MDHAALRHAKTHVLVDADALSGVGIVLDEAVEHHLARVLRLRDGETVGVTDGAGRWCIAGAVAQGTSLRLDAISEVVVEQRSPRPITVATAIPKGDRFDWLIQKVTELGVDRLVLLDAERSVVRWKAARVEHHLARAQRIADEALRQSRRVWRLAIEAPVEATAVLGSFVLAEPGGRRLQAGDVAVAIGPEGGWTDVELEHGAGRVDLGPTVLRTETAAIAVAARCVALEH